MCWRTTRRAFLGALLSAFLSYFVLPIGSSTSKALDWWNKRSALQLALEDGGNPILFGIHINCNQTNYIGATAITAFSKFLKGEEVGEEYVRKCIETDESGESFVCVMDKFGMYLSFSEGKKGKLLAQNTAIQYYRQAKIYLLDQFPQHRASLESRLLKMGKTLDNFCLKRDGGGFVAKAPPCRKADLKRMLVYWYTNACSESDYQDAALLCLL
ncbi:hypothetical protein PHMEG_0004051 [Phytophthora megakarya]|uniref:Uncharacterized protein n=1 Tax=Phytophthora megakarya TaxID=4795 RepID=A0A225WWC0_9STRA|nr:hypothetical protein PHMEG_0004051 [Phytophthora megakarya]